MNDLERKSHHKSKYSSLNENIEKEHEIQWFIIKKSPRLSSYLPIYQNNGCTSR